MADKEVRVSLKPLIEYADCFIAVTPDNPRAMSCDELGEIAKMYCERVITIPSPVEAVKYASEALDNNDVLLVVGSLYLAGEVRETLLNLF
jgi:dihydrofolate synthase/folylpolyglutamate synthase